MKPLSDCRLYAFIDTAYLNGRAPGLIVQQLCDGGADLIQLRAKHASADEIGELAESILPITRKADVGLVINDHVRIAREVGAEVCHLGQGDFFDSGYNHVDQVRSPGSPLKVGLSTHQPAEAQRALKAAADYIAIGPVYATMTKPGAKPATLDYVRWAAANVNVPWFAIGGITLDNVDEVISAGARRICVVSAILNAQDIPDICKKFKLKLREGV